MKFSSSVILSLIDDLYLPGSNATHWQLFLKKLQQLTGATKVYLLLVDPEGHASIPLHLGCLRDFPARYAADWAHRDVVLAGYLDAQESTGKHYVAHRSAVIGDRTFHQSEIYKGVFRVEGDSQMCFAALSNLPGGFTGGLCLRRSDIRGPFEDDVIELLLALAPHLARALHLQQTLQASQSMALLGAAVLRAFDISAILTGSKGKVLYASPAAQRILAAGEGLRLSEGKLSARSSEDDNQLQELLGNPSDTDVTDVKSLSITKRLRAKESKVPPGYEGAMVVDKDGVLPIQLACIAFRPDLALDSQPAKLLFVADATSGTSPRSPLLRTLYRLTPTESNFVDLLIAGNDVKQAATALSLKETTARFHLKEIFRKTRVRSQPSLMRLALSLPVVPESNLNQALPLSSVAQSKQALPLLN
jgi:DNA-binding CsgD family transcriptional regulator/GAF domain-containing protein